MSQSRRMANLDLHHVNELIEVKREQQGWGAGLIGMARNETFA